VRRSLREELAAQLDCRPYRSWSQAANSAQYRESRSDGNSIVFISSICQHFHNPIFLRKKSANNLRITIISPYLLDVHGFNTKPFLHGTVRHLLTMSFRKIRPSFGDRSASTSNPGQSTSESTGSDPRRARGEKEAPESSTSSSRRRRVPESVTRNACLNCRKARAKVSSRPLRV
jgi:hypothetical protein